MARTASSKHVIVLVLGTLILFLGAVIAAVGAFRSVMHDPKVKGPYTVASAAQVTLNRRHYVALIAYFPEIFDCGEIKDIYKSTNTVVDSELVFTTTDVQTAATYYCWRESGDQVWLYAFGFVVLFIYLILAFTAAFRRSGHQAALGGLGFSVVLITWALLVIVHYEEHSNIPRALTAFADCGSFASNTVARTAFDPWTPSNSRVAADFGLEVLPGFNPIATGLLTAGGAAPGVRAFYYQRRGGTDTFDEAAFSTPAVTNWPNDAVPAPVLTTRALSAYAPQSLYINFNRSPARIFGPTPRRAWLCDSDWTYDTTFRITQNLIFGGIATLILGALFTTTALAYLAYPILGVVKAADVQAQRASNLAADVDYTDYYDYEDY